jgi:hypothetical protein
MTQLLVVSFLSRPEIAVMGCGFQAEVTMAAVGLALPDQLTR